MPVEKVEFANSRGIALRGRWHRPAVRPRAQVLFAHCFTCTAASRAAVTIARALVEQGLAVLRFDFTGLGESDGEFAMAGFSANVDDLRAAAAFMEKQGAAADILVGHSLGGTAALAAAPSIDSCRAVVTIGAPATASHVEHLIGDDRETLERQGRAQVDIGGRTFSLDKAFLEDLGVQGLPENVRGLRRALLVMHSPHDAVVSIDHATALFRHALHPKSFVSLDDADHLLTRHEDAAYAARVLAAWAARYVAVDPAVEGAGERRPEIEATCASTPAGSLATELTAGPHVWGADEPEAVGGTGTGPTPYDLLAGALAACTSMTLQLYARRKGLALESAEVCVSHRRVHAEDCVDCETKPARIERFERRVVLLGALDDASRRRLLEIAERCPVHRTLTGTIEIETASEAKDAI
jgi:uncharacterized OsmC-like protein/alpha-beta hydrolase superfamily lysophospholipase